MINGVDIQIKIDAKVSSLDEAVRVIRLLWPLATFENADDGMKYSEYKNIPFQHLKEIFVYKNLSLEHQWDELGAVPELSNTMIHLISSKDVLIVVVDSLDDTMHKIVDCIKSKMNNSLYKVKSSKMSLVKAA